MNKPTVHKITDAKPANSGNKWKLAKDITVALAPTVVTVVACAVIVKKLDQA